MINKIGNVTDWTSEYATLIEDCTKRSERLTDWDRGYKAGLEAAPKVPSAPLLTDEEISSVLYVMTPASMDKDELDWMRQFARAIESRVRGTT